MAVKKNLPRKNARQKKMLHTIAAKHDVEDEYQDSINKIEVNEDAIKRQFKIIQKDYFKLINNVTKGYAMVKGWVESQAHMRKDMLKSRLIKI